MEYKFDKEMDALLRQAARSGQVVSTADFDSHLDADEISMFAENVLPEKAKKRVTKHLADCNDCRNVLSNLILLNERTEVEVVSSAVEEKILAPWYKKLLVFPQIAYAMGGLALVFSGFIGFLIYQTANQTASFDMAKSAPTITANEAASGPNIGKDELKSNESSSNTMTANTNIASNVLTESDSDVVKTANTIAAAPNSPTAKIPSDEKIVREENKKELQLDGASGSEVERKDQTADSAADSSIADDAPMPQATPAPPPSVTTRSSSPKKRSDKMEEEALKMSGETETRKQVGGKTFNRVSGGWTDMSYRQNMPLTTVRRGSSQYKGLDSSIKIIAESLEGTVIVVSGSKAYRIQ